VLLVSGVRPSDVANSAMDMVQEWWHADAQQQSHERFLFGSKVD
jgi:hypothetical protein